MRSQSWQINLLFCLMIILPLLILTVSSGHAHSGGVYTETWTISTSESNTVSQITGVYEGSSQQGTPSNSATTVATGIGIGLTSIGIGWGTNVLTKAASQSRARRARNKKGFWDFLMSPLERMLKRGPRPSGLNDFGGVPHLIWPYSGPPPDKQIYWPKKILEIRDKLSPEEWQKKKQELQKQIDEELTRLQKKGHQ